MQIYSVVNVENLKLYEPPMIVDEDENVQVPSLDDFAPEYLKSCSKMLFWIGKFNLHEEEMLSIFMYD